MKRIVLYFIDLLCYLQKKTVIGRNKVRVILVNKVSILPKYFLQLLPASTAHPMATSQ